MFLYSNYESTAAGRTTQNRLTTRADGSDATCSSWRSSGVLESRLTAAVTPSPSAVSLDYVFYFSVFMLQFLLVSSAMTVGGVSAVWLVASCKHPLWCEGGSRRGGERWVSGWRQTWTPWAGFLFPERTESKHTRADYTIRYATCLRVCACVCVQHEPGSDWSRVTSAGDDHDVGRAERCSGVDVVNIGGSAA